MNVKPLNKYETSRDEKIGRTKEQKFFNLLKHESTAEIEEILP